LWESLKWSGGWLLVLENDKRIMKSTWIEWNLTWVAD
jgi:hypothetical protein